jgi:hypothetical protein
VKENAVSWKPVKLKDKDYPFVMKDDLAWWAEPSITDAARKMENLMNTSLMPASLITAMATQ